MINYLNNKILCYKYYRERLPFNNKATLKITDTRHCSSLFFYSIEYQLNFMTYEIKGANLIDKVNRQSK